jgi:hypothetical protein
MCFFGLFYDSVFRTYSYFYIYIYKTQLVLLYVTLRILFMFTVKSMSSLFEY